MGRGGLEGRLKTLEEQANSERHAPPEAQEKEQWLLRASIERREALEERDADHARSLVRLFRIQFLLSGMSTDELIERILSWRPVPDGGWSRAQAEREVGLAIHNREDGTERMACPPAWRESFARGDELRERYEAIPDEVLAEGYVRLGQIEEEGEDEEVLAEWTARYEEPFGITAKLVEEAVGPDAGEITEEERTRRIEEYLADHLFGEKGYRIWRNMERLERLEGSTGGEGGR